LSIPVSKKKRGANKKFNDILLSVIDDSLMRIGSSMRPVVYHCLERVHQKRGDSSQNGTIFSMFKNDIWRGSTIPYRNVHCGKTLH
jgi:hypothetical protein